MKKSNAGEKGAKKVNIKSSAKSTLIQIVIFLIVVAGLILYNKSAIAYLFSSGEISKIGLIINAIIIALFILGMTRIIMTLFRYISEHRSVIQMAKNLKMNALDPTSHLHSNSLIVQRYNSVKWISDQGSPVNQAALASGVNASESTRLTVIRFVHSTLILAGVFGTVVSLSMALIGAAGLLNSPEGVKEMGAIISSMSSALSSTVTAIVCFFIFAYFYLRLNDSRIQLLNAIEEVTGLYILPKVSHSEEGMMAKVSELTASLNQATDRLLSVQQTFSHAGQSLQLAVDDLHGQVKGSSINEIKDLIRKGFHLSEPEYAAAAKTMPNKTTPQRTLQEKSAENPLQEVQSTNIGNADFVTTDKKSNLR